MKPLRLLAIALPLAVACSKEPLGPPARITALPRALTAREQQLIQADNRFAIKLLKEANTQTRDTLPNLFVSPLSAAMALAMTYNGAGYHARARWHVGRRRECGEPEPDCLTPRPRPARELSDREFDLVPQGSRGRAAVYRREPHVLRRAGGRARLHGGDGSPNDQRLGESADAGLDQADRR